MRLVNCRRGEASTPLLFRVLLVGLYYNNDQTRI